ncbi:hypothetical protein CGJ05_22080, partial [Vibrio parahaemolyticus]
DLTIEQYTSPIMPKIHPLANEDDFSIDSIQREILKCDTKTGANDLKSIKNQMIKAAAPIMNRDIVDSLF